MRFCGGELVGCGAWTVMIEGVCESRAAILNQRNLHNSLCISYSFEGELFY
jgi:hypothetical protein